MTTKHSIISREEFEEKLIKLIDSARYNLISNIIINKSLKALRLQNSLYSLSLVTLILASLFYIISILSNIITNQSSSIFEMSILLASIIAASSLTIVKFLHDDILPPNAKKLVSLIIYDKDLIQLYKWFSSFISFKRQMIVSTSFGFLAIPTLMLTSNFTSTQFKIGSYIISIISLFCVSHGAYCAITIPTLARTTSKIRMQMFWLKPADSPWIKMASISFTKLAIADSLVFTCCIIGIYWLHPSNSFVSLSLSIVWFLMGLFAVTFAFLYPHYCLSISIQKEKNLQISRIQNLIHNYKFKLDKMNEDDFKNLSNLTSLYDQILNSRGTSIDVQALRGYFTSIIIPSISFILSFIDLKKLTGIL